MPRILLVQQGLRRGFPVSKRHLESNHLMLREELRAPGKEEEAFPNGLATRVNAKGRPKVPRGNGKPDEVLARPWGRRRAAVSQGPRDVRGRTRAPARQESGLRSH